MNEIETIIEKNKLQDSIPFSMEINNKKLNTDGTQDTSIVNFDVSFGETKTAFDDIGSLYEKASKYVHTSANFPDTKIFLAEKDKNGVEKRPPSPKSEYSKELPTWNRPTISPFSLGSVELGTLIGKTNANLHHECDFTIGLKMQVCDETIVAFSKNIKAVVGANLQSLLKAKIPFLGHILDIFKTLKSWFDVIMSYVNKIAMFIKCITEIIKAIVDFAKQLANLPARLLSQLTGCINGLKNMLKISIENMINNGIMKKMSSDISAMTGQVNAAKNSVVGSISSAKNAITSAPTSINNTYSNAIKSFDDTAKNPIPKINVTDLNGYYNQSNIKSLSNITSFKIP